MIWPKISNNLESRKSQVLENIETAEKQREDSEVKLEEYEEIIFKSKLEAKTIFNQAREKVLKDINAKREVLDKQIDDEIGNAEQEIKALRDGAPDKINKIAIETSSELIQKLMEWMMCFRYCVRHVFSECLWMSKFIKDSDYEKLSVEEIIKKSSAENEAGIFNNASQHWNHILFWKCMKPNGGGKIPEKLKKKIIEDFGSLDQFKKDFIQAGSTQFGSGWVWLSIKNGRLLVTKTANAANPLINGMKPILGWDVWEHSYYVDYRNRRPEYLNAFFDKLINWDFVSSQLD